MLKNGMFYGFCHWRKCPSSVYAPDWRNEPASRRRFCSDAAPLRVMIRAPPPRDHAGIGKDCHLNQRFIQSSGRPDGAKAGYRLPLSIANKALSLPPSPANILISTKPSTPARTPYSSAVTPRRSAAKFRHSPSACILDLFSKLSQVTNPRGPKLVPGQSNACWMLIFCPAWPIPHPGAASPVSLSETDLRRR